MKLTDSKILVIVESPNKVKTITQILKNAGYKHATVKASVGHIMVLGNGGPAFNSGIYPKQNFKMNLTVADDKKKVVQEVAELASKADKIYVMTDGDREGELIAWSLIKFCKLPSEKCCRAIAHEITPTAVVSAIENPIVFNDNLVNAGLTRMMVDKLIGYGLSPLGKKYIGAKSIGRCQSVGLKLIADREKEISEFIPEMYFNLYLTFIKNEQMFKAKYLGYDTTVPEKLTKQADVDAIINNCKAHPFVIESIEEIAHSEAPKAPFCTATFQQEAANKIGLRVKDAMSCAQKLFEGITIDGKHTGLITYMRTDSTSFAPEFNETLKQFITENYGKSSYRAPKATKKKATDQDSHEALRVVDLTLTPELLEKYITNPLLLKVYKLIWQRTVASAMKPATLMETLYIIDNNKHKFKLSFNTLIDLGHKQVYSYDITSSLDKPVIFKHNEVLQDTALEFEKKFTQPKARYTEASLVKELQQKEIGRPSTYATIVETLLSPTRRYATLEDKHITPTDRGLYLADYCERSFPTLINLNYTKEMEQSLDKIATGNIFWQDYMNIFFNDLQNVIKAVDETGLASDMPEKICPECGSPMIVRRSRFGKLFYGCSTFPKCRGIVNV